MGKVFLGGSTSFLRVFACLRLQHPQAEGFLPISRQRPIQDVNVLQELVGRTALEAASIFTDNPARPLVLARQLKRHHRFSQSQEPHADYIVKDTQQRSKPKEHANKLASLDTRVPCACFSEEASLTPSHHSEEVLGVS